MINGIVVGNVDQDVVRKLNQTYNFLTYEDYKITNVTIDRAS